MHIKQALLLIFSILLVITAAACNADKTMPTTTGKGQEEAIAPNCDRACLEGFANQYLDALVARDPSRVPLAENVKFTENGQELKVGDALWATASDPPTTYRIYLTDPKLGRSAFPAS